MGFIYKITCLATLKLYIGLTTNTINKRWKQHKDRGKKRAKMNIEDVIGKSKLYNAMAKYGIENFEIDIIEEVDDDKLCERECFWILHYDTVRNGYNILLGNRNINVDPKETAKRIAKSFKERLAQDVEIFRKHKEFLAGLPPHCIFCLKNDKPNIQVRHHQYCHSKYFAVANYESIEATKQAVVEFINTIETTKIKYDPKGKDGGHRTIQRQLGRSKAVKESNAKKDPNYVPEHHDLPLHFSYKAKSERPHIRIQDHERCKSKSFYVDKFGSFEATKKAAIEFLDNLIATNTVYVPKVQVKRLPKGVKKSKDGYIVDITIKDKTLKCEFVDKTVSDDINLTNAINALVKWRKDNKFKKIPIKNNEE
ncbi:group I intron endonuclease [Faustovirus]|nr:group I intron endonuclease [Faustovirus]